ncbi:uncharacterized protein LOC128092260 [Culex pipiens pallens]|uniref:uncharacterized protein LOC128092260 n=1 Tax=Culex pipiens pallens TaxID=42434 RepID=UPI001954B1E8|nr:uncharacterized protein LOC128092260 [Culex pipiens pallens]
MSGKKISARIDSRMPNTFRPRAVPQEPPAARCHSAQVSWTDSTAIDHRRPRTAAKPCHRLGHVPAYLRRSQATSMDAGLTKLAGRKQEQAVRKPAGGTAGSQARVNSNVFEDEPGEDREAKPVQKEKASEDKKTSCSSSEQSLVLDEIRSLRNDLRRSCSIGLFISPVDQSNVIRRLQ